VGTGKKVEGDDHVAMLREESEPLSGRIAASPQAFESQHRPDSLHQSPMILLHQIGLVYPPRSAEGSSVARPTLLELRQVVLDLRRIVVCVTEMPRSAIMITRSRKLSLKLVYQTHKMMICPSKCHPLKRSSIGTNRCIPSSSSATLAFAPEPTFASRLSRDLVLPANRFAISGIASVYGKANANIFPPAATATYCFPPVIYVIGDAFQLSFVSKCQSSFPVLASAAANAPLSSQKNTRPPAVESTPPQDTLGLVCGISYAILPVSRSIARRNFRGRSPGTSRDAPP
jgi:hypothetical protein